MDTCTENMSRGEILKFLSELWHAIGNPENYAFVKWVKGGRVFRITDLIRFYSELCLDLHEDCTPAYFGYFMFACGFEAIPPQYVDYYHEDFLKYDFSRIERIRPKSLILTPEAYLLHLEETSSSNIEFMSRNLFQPLELQEELRYDEIWPDPEGLPESPRTHEVDLPEDSVFILNTFPSEMLSESNSMQSSSSLCSKSSSEFEENIEHENGKTVDPISIKDLKSSLKLNLVRFISADSETDSNSKDGSNNKNGSSNLEKSSPSTPDTVSSPIVSPLGLSKVCSFPFIFDPLDPFNNWRHMSFDPKARTWSSPLSPSPHSCSTPFQLDEPSSTPCDQLTQLSSTPTCSSPSVQPYPTTVLTTEL